jgi:hypothetical protein
MSDWETEVQQIVRCRLEAQPEQIVTLLAEVEAEAWQEVRATLRRAMVAALLEEIRRADRPAQPVGPGETRKPGDKEAEGDIVQATDPLRRESDLREGEDAVADIAPAPATGIYVYGIVDRADLTGLPEHGVADGYPVTLQAHRDLAAVVSAVPMNEWGDGALQANLADMVWLEARVRGHQAVLDALLPRATLLPMKFATIYFSPAGLEELLATRYDEFVTWLGHLRGRQEWGLKLYCDESALAEHIARISPDVQRMRAAIESKSKGAAYLLTRKLQEINALEAERVSLEVADRAHTTLAQLSVAARLNPWQGTEVTGRSERMLLNVAYLVDEAALGPFRAALAEVAGQYEGSGFQFELSGPWPAYNFTALGVTEETNG